MTYNATLKHVLLSLDVLTPICFLLPSLHNTAGVCHSENDEDKKAIISLRRSLDEDPYNLDSLLALGTR